MKFTNCLKDLCPLYNDIKKCQFFKCGYCLEIEVSEQVVIKFYKDADYYEENQSYS